MFIQETTHMRAMVYHTHGSPDVLELQEVEKPTPQDNEVLIRIYATTASPNVYKNDTLKKENDSVDQSDEHSTCVFDSTFAKEK
jgi:hypothetical protein